MSLLLARLSGGGADGSGSGALSPVNLTNPSGTASGSAVAAGTLPAVSLTPVFATAVASAVVSGTLAPLNLSSADGTASASAVSLGSFADISLTAPTGYASVPTPELVKSGVSRLELYKLQEEHLRRKNFEERVKDEIAEAVAKVVEPVKNAKTQSKPVPRKPVETPRVSSEPVKTRLKSVIPVPKTEVATTLPLMLQVWSIMTETHLMLLGGTPVIEMLKAQIDAANDEEDIELLLLAA